MKCQWYQFWINRHTDEDSALPAHVQTHIKTCHRCSALHREQSDVHQQLKAAADGLQSPSPSPFLKKRILNEIAGEKTARTNPIGWRWISGGAFAVILAVVTLFLVNPNPNSEPAPPKFTKVTLAPEWIELTAKVTSGDHLFHVATNLNQPLQQELDLVIQNAQAALTFLANDFVPATFLASKN
jgi:hypothetical protein